MYQPGVRWIYNTGSDVLGMLIARASGRYFPDFLAVRIFAPLGMTDTGFCVALGARQASRRASYRLHNRADRNF